MALLMPMFLFNLAPKFLILIFNFSLSFKIKFNYLHYSNLHPITALSGNPNKIVQNMQHIK